MTVKTIANFLFELGMLKRQKHSGFALAGVRNLDSLADHTVRAIFIGYILAELEGADSNKVAVMLLIHDLPECRVGDHHKIAARYLKTDHAERRAFLDQLKCLPKSIQSKWLKLYDEKHKRTTKEGIIAQDADWLETALSAREFMALGQGYKGLQIWIDNVRKALETEPARQLLDEIERQQPHDWWKGLKKMTY
ncbi:MAG: HD domain-containing protein [Patescibacteria group bacterium]